MNLQRKNTTLNSIAKTSLLVAAMRATESKRSENDGRLFFDPFAEKLAGTEGLLLQEEAIKAAGDRPVIAIRTRYIDDGLKKALVKGIRQIVIIASGMDARAYRLHFPSGVKLYELDRSEVLNYKNEILKEVTPNCERINLAVDLVVEDWDKKLLQIGFNPKIKTLWIVEGLTMYLNEQNVAAIFHKLTSLSAQGSRLICDILGQTLLKAPFMKGQLEFLKKIGAPWVFATDEPEKFLALFGWDAVASQAGEVAPHRWPDPLVPRTVPNIPRGFFLEASKP